MRKSSIEGRWRQNPLPTRGHFRFRKWCSLAAYQKFPLARSGFCHHPPHGDLKTPSIILINVKPILLSSSWDTVQQTIHIDFRYCESTLLGAFSTRNRPQHKNSIHVFDKQNIKQLIYFLITALAPKLTEKTHFYLWPDCDVDMKVTKNREQLSKKLDRPMSNFSCPYVLLVVLEEFGEEQTHSYFRNKIN